MITLSSGADTQNNTTANACILALAGNDSVSSAAPGASLVGGSGGRYHHHFAILRDGQCGARARVRRPPATTRSAAGSTAPRSTAAPGDDLISAGAGGVLIAPGSGVDDVSSGDGDDTFVL